MRARSSATLQIAATLHFVGARLAREGSITFNINADSYDVFAGKPRSYR